MMASTVMLSGRTPFNLMAAHMAGHRADSSIRAAAKNPLSDRPAAGYKRGDERGAACQRGLCEL